MVIGILLLNSLSITISCSQEKNSDTQNFILDILRGFGITGKKQGPYRVLPHLTSTSQINHQSSINITSGPRYSWSEPNWPYKKNITILASKISADLTNFPLMIDLFDSDLRDTSKVQNSGEDILFINENGWTWTDELLTNGGFETGNLNGWITSGNWEVGTNPPMGNKGPQSGSFCAYTTDGGSTTDYIQQDVDLSSYIDYIDSGKVIANVSAWAVMAEDDFDETIIRFQYLDASKTVISAVLDTGIQMPSVWTKFSALLSPIPVNTRYIRVWARCHELGWDAGSVDSFSVKIANMGVKLDHEIELFEQTYNTTHAHLVAWVKTNLSSSQNTFLSMYYGNPTAGNQENPVAVWDENYVGVWHLGEESGSATDSTTYGTSGTISGGVTQNISGKLGKGYDFDGNDGSSVLFGDPGDGHLDFGLGSFTVSYWMNIDQSTSDYQLPIYKGGTTNSEAGYEMETNPTAESIDFMTSDGTTAYSSGNAGVTFDTWAYMVGVVDRSSNYIYLYQDGNDQGSSSISSLGSVDNSHSMALSPNPYPVDGMIDEVRISKSIRSSAWIETEYNNQYDPSSFYSMGEVEYKWAFPTFAYRKAITINATKISGNFTDFPVLVNYYDSDLHDPTKVQSDGDDILFTNVVGTQLDHEIELFNQNGNGTHANLVTWVKANLSSVEDTLIFMYYGNYAIESQENPEGVWDSNFKMVHHFDETTGTTSYDSTSNNEDGTIMGSISLEVTGKIGNSYQFNDTSLDQKVGLPPLGTLNAFTMEIWVNPNTGEKEAIWGREFTIGSNAQGVGITYSTYDPKQFGAIIPNGAEGSGSTRIDINANSETSVNAWNHLVVIYNGSVLRMYVNGVEVADSPKTGMSSPNYLFTQEPYSPYMGSYFGYTGYNWNAEEEYFDGKLDEARLSDIARSANWILTEYNNQYNPSSFYSIGEEEEKEGPPAIPGEYYVNNDGSNVDYSGDMGNLEDFNNMKGKDLSYANLQETAAVTIEWNESFETVNGVQSYTSENWWTDYWIQDTTDDYNWSISDTYQTPSANTGASGAQQGTWFIYTEASSSRYGNFILYTANSIDFSSLNNEKIEFYWNMFGANIDALYLEQNTSGSWSSVWSQVGAGSPDQSTWNFSSVDLSGLSGIGFLRFRGVTSGGYAGDISLDNVNITSIALTTNYRLEQEIQWTNIPYEFEKEELCLYVGTTGTEDIIVEVWNGSNWVQVFSDLIANSWNNISITSYLNSSTFTVRFIDGTQTSDNTTQDQWQIDAALIHVWNEVIDETPPVINDFGIDDSGTGTGRFWADVIDTGSGVANATIKVNGTNYSMSYNGSYWIYQLPSLSFEDYFSYQIVNSSDNNGNFLINPSNEEAYTFDYDILAPTVVDWEYYNTLELYGTFKANITDSWGEIDTVRVNVTTYNMQALMGQYTTFGSTIFAYLNDTLEMPNGLMDFQIIVNDTAGNEFISTTHQGDVFSNHPPIVENLTLSPAIPWSNCSLTLTYDYYDEDDHSEAGTEIRWYKKNDSVFLLESAYNDTKVIPASALEVGDQWYVNVTPKDGELFGETNTSAIITVLNTPPSASNAVVFYSGAIPYTTSTLNIDYTYDDHEGDGEDSTNRQVEWYRNGAHYPALDNSTSVLPGNTTKGETWAYRLRVHDGTGYSSWVTSDTILIRNSLPQAVNLALPSNPTTLDDLVADWDMIDADGDSEDLGAVLIYWYKDGENQSTWVNSVTIGAGNTSKGETWRFEIRVYDGENYSVVTPLNPPVVILNSVPTVSTVELAPTIPVTTDGLTATWEDADVDNDALTYTIRWYIMGVGLQAAYNDLSTVPASATVKGQIWYYNLTAFDGEDYSLEVSSPQVTVQNTPPEVSNLALTAAPKTMTNLVASWSAADNDTGDSLTFNVTWYLEGVVNCSWLTSATSATLTAGNTTKGDRWSFTVQAYDGEAYSSVISLGYNRTILNTAPVVANLTLTSMPTTTDPLLATFDYSDADLADNASLIFNITWYRNGLEQSALANTTSIGSGNTTKSEFWWFTVQAYDGESFSLKLESVHVQILNTAPEVSNLVITP
ncbi:MAG: DUF2341 domain-containing protein, partial [Promethearchaeota archaeon]